MKKRTSIVLVTLLVLIVAALGVGFVAMRNGTLSFGNTLVKDSGDNVSDFTAVFLTNGQVYFGKMYTGTAKELDLREIYYLQVNQNPQAGTDATKTTTDTADQQVVLVKLGEELHGPTDRMRINRDQVLFTESIKNDSKVNDAIKDYKAKK